MKEFKKIDLNTFASRGYQLTPIEFKDAVPFEVKRVYFITNFEPGSKTGEHCHKVEEEVFIQIQGTSIAVIDRGKGIEEVVMNGPGGALYVPNFVWHGFTNASPDCVIAALSSTHYGASREDYVEDYEEFKRISPYYR